MPHLDIKHLQPLPKVGTLECGMEAATDAAGGVGVFDFDDSEEPSHGIRKECMEGSNASFIHMKVR